MNQKRYTDTQVLCGLLDIWENITGEDDRFDANTRIDTFMKADSSWDDLDFADIFRRIESFFDFRCTDNEWTAFFGFDVAKRSIHEWEQTVAPGLTFGSLARFIAERAPVIASFDPIFVLDRQCAPAGVFIGIQQVAEYSTGNPQRFPPSEQIFKVMQGNELENFWTQLRWMTEHATPELPAFWRGVTGFTGCLSVLMVIAAIFVASATSSPIWIVAALFISLIFNAIAFAYKRSTNPLPPQIVTFRDLSILIANTRKWPR